MSAGERTRGSGPRELTGWTVLICLVAFFALVAGVNAIMIWAAVSTFGGVETENAYQAGLTFAREIADAATQDDLHWQVQAKVSPAAGATLVEVVAHDAAGRPLAGLAATARLAHPTDKRLDRIVELTESTAGNFAGRGAAPNALAGQWNLVVELTRDGSRVFRSRNRIFVN